MSSTSTVTSSVSTYIDCLGIDLQDLYDMTDAEREAFYEDALRGLSADEITTLESAIQAVRSTLKEDVATVKNELQIIIDSTSSSLYEIASAEYWYDVMDGMYDVATNLSSDFGDAQTQVASESVDGTDGSDVPFTASNPQNGEEYVIDCTTTDTTADDPLFADDNEHQDDASYVDSDGDGYVDVQADTDDDGKADVDTNGDGVITEKDMLSYNEQNTTTQTVTLNLESGDTIELASYDAATGTTRFAITKEDGTVYYVTIKGTPDIHLSGSYKLDTTGIADTWDPGLLSRMYENTTTDTSFADALGVTDPDAAEGDYYSIVDMVDQYDSDTGEYSYTVEPGEDDFAEGRDYTVNCQSGVTDTINLNFPTDAELEFTQGDNGELIITATYNGQTVTVTINNWEAYAGGTDTAYDVINIIGGVIDTSDAADLYYINNGSCGTYSSGWYYATTVANLITYNGTNIYDWYLEQTGETISDAANGVDAELPSPSDTAADKWSYGTS